MKHIAILASGRGSNADNICEYFKENPDVEVSVIISNKENPGVRDVAMKHHVPFIWHKNKDFESGEAVLETLRQRRVDYVILAGFLRKIPLNLIKAYSRRMINIHPALLPKYGGKGMYGKYVHEAVKAAEDDRTGITIHFVDPQYDKGKIIFQMSCDISPADSTDDIAEKIHKLEYRYFPKVIESVIMADEKHTLG